jgi:hypothetical protein
LATCLVLSIALAILNPHITNSVYGNRTKHYRKKIENQKNGILQKKTIVLPKLQKRIQLINWVLENMNNPDTRTCDLMESKMNELILAINQTHLNLIFYFPEISSFIIEKSINGDFKNAIIFLLNLDLQI